MDPEEVTVDTVSGVYARMAKRWELSDDLIGGTYVMRQAGQKWLPREDKEPTLSYQNRLKRSVLYGAYKDTIRRIVAKPFSRPIVVPEEPALPEPLDQIEHDVDLEKTNLSQFAGQVLWDAVGRGLSHVFVDFPNIGTGLNLAEERQIGARPYFVHVKAHELIGVRWKKDPTGRKELTQIRIKTEKDEPLGDYGEHHVEYVRVVNAPFDVTDEEGETVTQTGTWELWRRPEGEEDFVLHDQGIHTFDGIPLVTFYTHKLDFYEASPPLEDLAYLNLAHWQSLSDQRNILRFARVGILAAFGFSEDEIAKGVEVGGNKVVFSENEDARLEYVEHEGKAIESGEKDLENLERRMETLGMQPFTDKMGSQTATGRVIDKVGEDSTVQAWIRSLELFFNECYEVSADWYSDESVVIPEGFDINIFNEFSITQRNDTDLRTIDTARARRDLSRQTWIEELKRRGTLRDKVMPEEEEVRLEDEAENEMTQPIFPNEESGEGTGQNPGVDEDGNTIILDGPSLSGIPVA